MGRHDGCDAPDAMGGMDADMMAAMPTEAMGGMDADMMAAFPLKPWVVWMQT